MQFIPTTSFGRRTVSAGDLAARAMADIPLPREARGKWDILKDLTAARAAFQVTDRDLAVLSALISFHPHPSLLDGDGPVVFPSNASLSSRAHGMAESTLRRHLSALTRAGLILRRDSPNGKRYARRDEDGGLAVAYGFDLRPLLLRDTEIIAASRAAREAAQRLKALRETVVLTLRDATGLILLAPCPQMEARAADIRRALRRKLDAEALTELRDAAADLLEDLNAMHPANETEKTDGNAAISERHIQYSNKHLSESEPALEKSGAAGVSSPALPLRVVLSACPDAQTYADRPITDWESLHRCAGTVRPMLGISDHAWDAAQCAMGPVDAAITVLAMLQKFDTIRSPGGYLRSLTTKATEGGFSPGPMVMALLSAQNKIAV